MFIKMYDFVPQMFTKVWKGQISNSTNVAFSGVFDNILKVYFQLTDLV
jgi:hypothetical protein